MTNDQRAQLPPIPHNSKIGIVGAAILMLGPIAAGATLRAGTRIYEGFEPFEKSANERVSAGFDGTKGLAPVSDQLTSALASLSQSVQGAQKPLVRAEGNE
jgi:hypothetical protein